MPYKDPEKRREYNAWYRATHRDVCVLASTRWNKANPERKRANDRAYRLRHPEKIKADKRRWNAANKAKRAEKRAKQRETFAFDCAAWAKYRAGWRIIYAKRVIRRGIAYSPKYYLRIPDFATKGERILDTRSQWLINNLTDSQRAYARELAVESWNRGKAK